MSLHQLLRTLLQQYVAHTMKQAEQVVRSAAQRKAEESRRAQPSEAGPSNPFAPCDVGIVAALELEVNYFQDKLRNKQRIQGEGFSACIGELDQKTVSVVCGGIGQAAVERATNALIAGHRPRWIISAGFAGGLQESISLHDLVLADSILNLSGERLAIDLAGTLPAFHGPKFKTGTLITTNRIIKTGTLVTANKIIKTPAEKAKLGNETSALAVDMESWAVARVCREEGQKFLSVRVISDSIRDEIPADIATMVDLKTSTRRIGRALGNIFRRPSSVKDLWRLKENAMTSSDRLATFLAALVEQVE